MRKGMHHTEWGKHYFVDIIYRKLQQTVENLLPNNSSPETQNTHTLAPVGSKCIVITFMWVCVYFCTRFPFLF